MITRHTEVFSKRVDFETKSAWDLKVKLVDLSGLNMEGKDLTWMAEVSKGINFVATRRI